jgi:tRNA-dihydrouridine synthase A
MMDWTDRHCRYLHRLFAPHALLYTEMIVAAALVRGDAARLLEHDPAEHPVALQLGGSDPRELAEAARIGAAAGYAEINLNVGCPSDRVQSGAFGACLMLRPTLVAECVRRMRDAVQIPVTVKCRIGIDEKDDYEFFSGFVEVVEAAGVDALIVHARAAILGGLGKPGLTPKENREVPPLRYEYVHRLKAQRGDLQLVINGGVCESAQARAQTARGLGVMIGRAAYHRPAFLSELERDLIDPAWRSPGLVQVIEAMVAYARQQAPRGVRLHAITRHMHGLMSGREGARSWRRFLSDVACRPDAVPETLHAALPILQRGMAA